MSKDKMTPTPWALSNIDEEGDARVISRAIGLYANQICLPPHKDLESAENWCLNAQAIVSAVNNTYGAEINPECVPSMLDALKEIHDIWGQEWGWRDHPAFLKAKAAIEKATIK